MKPVLVVDDEAVTREMVAAMLGELGLESRTAENGSEGLKLFQQFTPDIVITDIRMPKMDGLELLSKIKAANRNTEVLVITGFGEMESAVRALQMDASDFIQKPFNYEAFTVAVKRAQEKLRIKDELSQAQVQLLQAEKMASLGQLAAGVAHEINNPIGFVMSNLGTLKKYIKNVKGMFDEFEGSFDGGEKKEVQTEFQSLKRRLKVDFIMDDMESVITESIDGIQRVRHIVQDLRNFSHVDSKEYMPFNVNECVESTLHIIWNEIKYHCQVEKRLSDVPTIYGYPQQINQVLMNVIINAAQAIKENGLITITTKREEGGVRIEISDNGGGIPEEIISKIFDPFFTTKDVGEGTGLGLNISYGIVRKHGGRMEVKSEVGKGSTFSIRLPEMPPV